MRKLLSRQTRAAWRGGAAALACVVAMVVPSHVAAQTYPAKPIRMLVGFSPGGAPDIIARMLGPRLQEALGQSIVIENKPGATGIIAAVAVAKSSPDGYTVLMGNVSLAISPSMSPKPPFDPSRDFEPIGMVASLPLLLVVNPALPANSLRELVDLAKAKPGTLNYASVGYGSPHHLSGELLSSLANTTMVHVPYKGGGSAVQAVVTKEVDMLFITPMAALQFVRAGKLRALAVTAANRSPAVPDVPTVLEGGMPGFMVDNWHALYAPKGTPKEVVARLNAALNQVLGQADLKQQLIAQQGAEVWVATPDEARKQLLSEIDRWGKLISSSGVKMQ